MEIEVVSAAGLSVADRLAWSRLQDETGLKSPFLSPHWLQACAAAGGPDARQAKVAILRDRGDPVGFLPARVSRVTAMPVGAPMSDYQGVVAHQGVSVCPQSIIKALGVRRLDFSSLPVEQNAFAPFMRGEAESQVVDLSDGYDAYAAARRVAGASILQDTAKKRRKLEREHGEVAFCALSAAQSDFDSLFAWKRAQYRASGQTDIFEAGWTHRLLQSLFEQGATGADRFGGSLFTLHAGGKLAASHFALRRGDVLHAWFIAHDESFARYSPGVILINEILKWAADEGLRELDLGPGDYRFKQSLANVKRPVAHGYVGRPSSATLARALAYRLRDTAESLPLGRFSALPGKAMRRLDLRRGLG